MSLAEAVRTEPFDQLDQLDRAGLERWWRRRIRRVLAIAYEELPFYRRRFDRAGVAPTDVRRLEDLTRIPRFDKVELLAELERRGDGSAGIARAAPGAGMVMAASSGTAGTTFVELPARWRREQGRSSLRAHWWAGLRPGAPFLISAPAWHTYAAVQTWIAEKLGAPVVVIAGTYLPRFAPRIVDAILSFRPRFLTMFLPMLFSLLAEARRRGLEGRELFAGLDALVVTGAPVTPGMRTRVRRETGVGRVVELAGSSENLLAVECGERAGLHVVPDTCYAEVIDPRSGAPAPPGRRGRIVHTALVPWGSLYLRYDGGDLGVCDPTPCPCGLPSPRIELHGRADEVFELGGRQLLPYDVQLAVEECLPELAGVPFSILRESLTAGRLTLVFPKRAGHSPAEALKRSLHERFGVAVEVRFATELAMLFKGVPSIVSERGIA